MTTAKRPSKEGGGRAAPGVLAVFDALLPAPSWRGWRAFVQALYGLPMDDAAAALYRRCTSRATLPTARASRGVVLAGRRCGKSRMCGFVGTYAAACLRYDHILARGEIGVVQIMAPSRVQARVIFGYIEGFLDSIPALRGMVERRTADEIDLRNHGNIIRIAVTTASYKLPRGFTVIAFIGDESGFWESSDSANPDTEIWRSILPGLATTNGPAIIISTPYRRAGLAFELFDKHFGREGSDTLIWTADSRSMNALLDPAIIERAFQDDPEWAASEYGRDGLISFRSDLQSLFLREPLYACVRSGPRELAPQAGIHAAFVDTASGSDESFALGIGHRDATGRAVVDLAREWASPFDPFEVTGEVCRIVRRYRCLTVMGDRYAPGWVAGAFEREGIKYEVSERNKSQIFMDMAALVNSQSVELPDDPRLLNQFLNLQRRPARSGRDSVDHRTGQRDDLANATAGAATVAVQSSGPVSLDAIFHGCSKNSGLQAGSVRALCLTWRRLHPQRSRVSGLSGLASCRASVAGLPGIGWPAAAAAVCPGAVHQRDAGAQPMDRGDPLGREPARCVKCAIVRNEVRRCACSLRCPISTRRGSCCVQARYGRAGVDRWIGTATKEPAASARGRQSRRLSPSIRRSPRRAQ